jgi:hypothetical protein
MTYKQIAMNAIGKVQKTKCQIPWQFETEAYWQGIKDNDIELELMGFFFSKEFAKYFFGVDIVRPDEYDFVVGSHEISASLLRGVCSCCTGFESVEIYAYQYHLQQMVIAENPLKYLELFLN